MCIYCIYIKTEIKRSFCYKWQIMLEMFWSGGGHCGRGIYRGRELVVNQKEMVDVQKIPKQITCLRLVKISTRTLDKLDYCNSLHSGISQTNLDKLQHIQNSLARVITNTSKCQHTTPTLKKLHWLPIKQRIDYKICLLTYKTLTNQQTTYLYNSLSFLSYSVSTRSSDSLVLSIPYVRSSLGKRAFSVIVPRLWNSPPPDIRNSSSLSIFRSRLKTHLLKIAFPP